MFLFVGKDQEQFGERRCRCVTIMEKWEMINRIKELCNKKNDREIALDFLYKDRLFHAQYVFLGNKLYIADKLYAIEVEELDGGILSRILELLQRQG